MTKPSPHTIMLIDGHPIWRHGIASVVSKEPDLEICGEISDVESGLHLISLLNPGVIVMDIAHQAGEGVGLIRSIILQHPTARILVLSLNDECLFAERVIRAGARGYLMKQESGDVLVMAIRQILKDGIYLSNRMREVLLNKALSPLADNGSADLSALTDREMQVFTLLGEGKGNGEIGHHMNVSVKTVDAYRAHIKYKLRLRNGMELIRLAILHAQPYSTSAGFSKPARSAIPSFGPQSKIE